MAHQGGHQSQQPGALLLLHACQLSKGLYRSASKLQGALCQPGDAAGQLLCATVFLLQPGLLCATAVQDCLYVTQPFSTKIHQNKMLYALNHTNRISL
jgi:hypothetical protein